MVGSKESSMFIVKLVSSDKLSNHVALFLLFSFPFNIRQTSEEIPPELEVGKKIIKAIKVSSYSVVFSFKRKC